VTGSHRQLLSRLRSLSPRTLAILATALTAIVALGVFGRVMARDGYRRTGTNSLEVPTHAIVPPGKRLCQFGEWVPKGTGAVNPWVGGVNGKSGGLMTVTVSEGGRVVAGGRSRPAYTTGLNRFKLDRTIDHDVRDATVCFTNRSQVTAFMYGQVANGARPAQAPAYQDGVPTLVRIDYFTGRAVSWWWDLGRIAHRFPLTKAGFLGPWSFWASMAALLLLIGAAAVRIVREAPR